MTLGLRARATLAVMVLVLALTVLATIVVSRADRALVDVERARFQAATAQLADALGYAVLARSEALLAVPLDAFANSPDLVRVEVLALEAERGPDGAAPLASRAGRAASRGDDVSITVPVRTRAGAPGDDGELAAFGVAEGAPRDIGRVVAVFSSAATAEVQQRTRREIVMAALGLGVVGLAAVALLMTSVVRRVRKVADAAARVRAGAIDTKVDAGGGDELGQLAVDFNAMTSALVEQQKKIDDAAQALAERESLAAIGRATAVIAHELKNPLGILLGASQIVGDEKKPMAARMSAAGIVEEEVRRLSHTLEDLLAYAKPRAPAQRPVDVRALCASASVRATSTGGPMHGRDVVVHSGGADGPSAGARTLHALVDEGHAQQVLLNLLQNAAQAGARKVTLAIERHERSVRIVVTDDGPGIAPDIREQLFVPFATNKQRGTGLGLAASRRLARDNGGDLTYESATAPGARFVLTLPEAP